jgi:UDP-N-acetylglucosamine 4,6-dehydratase
MNKNIFYNKVFFITGGTGSFGKRFVNKILEEFNPKKIIIYSRDELKQSEMQTSLLKYKKKLRFFIGDVRDLKRLILASEHVDFLVHAAALKHIHSGEYNPFEVIKTNIIGTQNVIDAACCNKIPKSIFLSTDKAVSPINLYGATKLAGEKLFIASNNYSVNSKFSVAKYGNVFNSRGSVFPVFLKQKKEDELLKLTHKEMTRFNISLNEGVNLVLFSLQDMRGGETYVPKMRSFKIIDLVKIFKPKKGYKIIGIRPGEKLHEELISASDCSVKIEFDKYFVVLPSTIENKNILKFIKNFKSQKGKILKNSLQYDSLNAANFLKIKELEEIISNLD